VLAPCRKPHLEVDAQFLASVGGGVDRPVIARGSALPARPVARSLYPAGAAVTLASSSAFSTCRPASSASASRRCCMISVISSIATRAVSGNARRSPVSRAWRVLRSRRSPSGGAWRVRNSDRTAGVRRGSPPHVRRRPGQPGPTARGHVPSRLARVCRWVWWGIRMLDAVTLTEVPSRVDDGRQASGARGG
jgi:hypothetical protein